MAEIIHDIDCRTFGVEIEMCDFDRSRVTLPEGFEWNKDEQIYNTDGVYTKEYGGEINTPPMLYTKDNLDQIEFVYKQLKEAGGRVKWTTYTHVHIYAGDLTLEQLKRLIEFEYCTYPFLKKYCQIGDWEEICLHSQPLITEKKYKELKSADTINDLNRMLSNQSKKGYVRYSINVASFFVRNTVEFRCFNASTEFEEVKNCIDATYKMFYYAINNKEEDFQNIKTYDDFVKTLELNERVPQVKIPLIYMGNPYNVKETFKTKPIGFNSKMCSSLIDGLESHGVKEIAIVNSFFFQYELALWKRYKISIYNQDDYCNLLYELTQGKKIKYSGNLEWLQAYNSDDTIRQVAIALYIYKIMKYIGDSQYKKSTIFSYQQKAEESIIRTEKSAKELIEMLNNVDYKIGNVDDAIREQKVIFFSFGKYKKSRRAFKTISKNSDYDFQIEEKRVCYYDFVERLPKDLLFFMFSKSPYLSNLNKVAYLRSAGLYREGIGVFLYSNYKQKEIKASLSYEKKKDSNFSVEIPSKDLVIDDYKKLGIYRVPSSQFYELQTTFIKKVDKCSRAPFCYVVMYDKYCVGGLAYDFPKNKKYNLWQLSDFCTNNDIPRLSKLILLCALSLPFQKMISRALGIKIKSVITFAYTDSPVLMKYRGLYKKDDEFSAPHKLAYYGELGKFETLEDVIEKYKKLVQNAGK